jgi:Domain of unknown function (DUF4337)
MTSRPTETPPADKPKSFWERVVTLTPVVMTLVATVLAGLSSSEMTRAQFYRATAAQYQSKAGDQWAFFQAKKIRGTELELTVDRLPVAAKPGAIGSAMLLRDAQRLCAALEEARKKIAALPQAALKTDSNLKGAVDAFQASLHAKYGSLTECQKQFEAALHNDQLFAYVGAGALPEAQDPAASDPKAKEALNDPQLGKAVKAIGDRRPESEIALLVKPLKPATILAAIAGAESHSLSVEKASDPIDDAIKKLTGMIGDLLAMAANCHRVAQELDHEGTPGEAEAVNQSDKNVNAAAEGLNSLWLAAKHDYTARRYKREAIENMNLAVLLEVQVHQASAISDAHRVRSQYFFFGLLIAQAGVFISSLALAAKQRSLLWSLAAMAGLAAGAFSGWVYLSM